MRVVKLYGVKYIVGIKTTVNITLKLTKSKNGHMNLFSSLLIIIKVPKNVTIPKNTFKPIIIYNRIWTISNDENFLCFDVDFDVGVVIDVCVVIGVCCGCGSGVGIGVIFGFGTGGPSYLTWIIWNSPVYLSTATINSYGKKKNLFHHNPFPSVFAQ